MLTISGQSSAGDARIGCETVVTDVTNVFGRIASMPIVASIKSKPGELAGAPYSETDGHLIVLRGYDSDGNFLVNDPAGSDAGKGQLVYARRDIATVWLTNGRGTAYLFTKPGQQHLLDSMEAPSSPAAAEPTR